MVDILQKKANLLVFWLPDCNKTPCHINYASLRLALRVKKKTGQNPKFPVNIWVQIILINKTSHLVNIISSHYIDIVNATVLKTILLTEAGKNLGKLAAQYGVAIHCKSCHHDDVFPVKHSAKFNKQKSSLTLLWRKESESDDIEITREKRNTNCHSCCQVRQKTIYFDTIGWNSWILYPSYFSFHYCAGNCKNDSFKKASAHALLIGEIRSSKAQVYTDPPCCVPTSFKTMSILFRKNHDQNIYLLNIPSISAETCGCS